MLGEKYGVFRCALYTESAIRNNVIPTLRAFANNPGNTVAQKNTYLNQVKVWEQILANNAANKRRAAFDKNISFFGSSGPISNTTTSSVSKSSAIEFDMEIDRDLAIELGFEIAGWGLSGGANIHMRTEFGNSTTKTITKTTTFGYVLDDNDALDNFTVNVRKDPVYNSPVFQTVAGQSSCPPEDFTLPRDEIQLLALNPVVSDVPPNSDAVFNLELGNLSVDASARTYNLSFDQASNPFGATVSIGGSVVNGTSIPYSISQYDVVPVTVNVKRNQANNAFTYEGLKFTLSDACSGDISKTISLSASFQVACSNITMAEPEENWICNQGSANLIKVVLKDYTLSSLTNVTLEYARVGSNNWRIGFTRLANQLNNSVNGTTINWNVASLTDGEYHLRIKLACAGGLIYTQRITGIIDRNSPLTLGIPQPTDGNFVVGDEISYTFNENINTAELNDNKVEMRLLSGQTPIPVTVNGFGNKLVITPSVNLITYSGQRIQVLVKNISDVYGNIKNNIDTSSFEVGTFIPATGPKSLQVSVSPVNVSEGASNPIQFTFTLPLKAANDIQINFSVGGTASYPADYSIAYSNSNALNSFTGPAGTLIIPRNQRTAILRLFPKSDVLTEADESIKISLSDGGDYFIGANYGAIATIANVGLSAPVVSGPASFCEGNSITLVANHTELLNPDAIFTWSNGATGSSIVVSETGSYVCTITNSANGMSGSSTPFSVVRNALPNTFAGADFSILQNTGNILLSANPMGGIWSGTGINGNSFTSSQIPGNYTLIYCVTNVNGCSKCDTLLATIQPEPTQAPTPTISAGGPLTFCQGGSVVLISSSATGNNWSNGAITQSITATVSGNYTVTVGNGTGSATSAATSVTVNPLPPIPSISAGGPLTFPPGGSVVLTSSSATGNTWSNGEITQSITVLLGGSYSVTVSNGFCSAISSTVLVTINIGGGPVLPADFVIQGPAGVCINASGQIFSVAEIAGATSYLWTLPSGATGISTTNSISLAFSSSYTGGQICVKAVNSFGSGNIFCRSINRLTTAPTVPVAILGPVTDNCVNQIQTFSIAAVANASSYVWTIPANTQIVSGQGTTSIQLQINNGFSSGILNVKAVNCIGSSANKSLTIYLRPLTPASISGPINGVCALSTQSYSCPITAGATSYQWTVPTNMVISNGQGTNSISVVISEGFISGLLSITSVNACSTSTARSLTIRSVPAMPGVISRSGSSTCAGGSLTYSILPVIGALEYKWIVPANCTITSNNGNSIILNVPNNFVSGLLSVIASNACGNSALRSITIKGLPQKPGTISGKSFNLCETTSYVYSIVDVTGADGYNWAVPTGCTITSNSGTSISVSYPVGFVSGNISVVATSSCGNSTASTLAINQTLALPGSITGQTANLCSGTTVTYKVAAVPGATSYVWTVPEGASLFNQSSNSISVSIPTGFVSGNLTVAALGICGSSPIRTWPLGGFPAFPGLVTGQTSNLCSGGTFAYSILPVAGANTYNWSIPPGCTIINNTGTGISLQIPPTFISGTLSVSASNTCGTGAIRKATLNRLPATPAVIVGPDAVCPGATALKYSVANTPGLTYNWVAPPGASITSQTGNSVTVNWGPTTGVLSLKTSNACGLSGARSKSVYLFACRSGDLNDEQILDSLTAAHGEMRISPNPSNGIFAVKFTQIKPEGTLGLFNALGQMLFTKKIEELDLEINVSHLPIGIYTVKYLGNSKIPLQKIIKF